jgi:hypothetical protein
MPDNPTLALVCYPDHIWQPSVARHPPGPGYCWRAHFRDIVRIAGEVYRAQPIELRVAGESEAWFIQKLGLMSEQEREDFIREMEADPRPDMMRWLDPVPLTTPARRPVAAAARRSR